MRPSCNFVSFVVHEIRTPPVLFLLSSLTTSGMPIEQPTDCGCRSPAHDRAQLYEFAVRNAGVAIPDNKSDELYARPPVRRISGECFRCGKG
jgi:hypothetical protein